tara:strand:+ start:550 stop:750 length:201 start_codon:yes stop_codon:yes gene_type:complete
MHTVFFLDYHLSGRLMQMPIAQQPTWVFVALFAVHNLTHVARIYILYLTVTVLAGRMASPAELPHR